EIKFIEKALNSPLAVPGRLERVGGNQDYLALVDYAHTPDALKTALTAIKALKPRRLITVFGCGGDRDRGKRPLMGLEAGKLSDLVILTSDNPRTEEPLSIINEVAVGLNNLGLKGVNNPTSGIVKVEDGQYIIEVNRQKAIETMAALIEKGDAALIAGKGHETYQILGRQKIDFDDRQKTLSALIKEGKS
ncbi:MAG: UDP-N-acetylmuramoyl-L-alanyl-D-glutamate--2,6-diaminopimelate ligase, partial [Deltaproteobacteria bacterium]|nr:UDP-N-acetylmuramoyl-L-alanyl-D-glutamate--2,6-diaminopimelate ligase [Deltaproteobacteria bacterium]